MRSHYRICLLLVSALAPVSGFSSDSKALKEDADGLRVAREEIAAYERSQSTHSLTARAGYLSVDGLRKAFKEFDIAKRDGIITLFGSTAPGCMDQFEVRSDSKQGRYSVYFKGGDARCLDVAKLDPEDLTAQLSRKEGAKMSLTDSFKELSLYSENLYSDRHRERVETLLDASGEGFSHLSAADLALERKKEEDAKRAAGIDHDIAVVTSCINGISELDEASSALGRLLSSSEAMSRIAEEEGEGWIERQQAAINARTFAACEKQVKTAKGADIGICDERLAKLVANDPSYDEKVKKLYLAQLARFYGANTLPVEEAFDKAKETLAKLREMPLSEEDVEALEATEKKMYEAFLAKAAKEGIKSEAFKQIAGEFTDFVLDGDVEGCLGDGLTITMAGRMNPRCQQANAMAMMLRTQSQFAHQAQIQINFAQLRKEQLERDQALKASCDLERSNAQALNQAYQASIDCVMVESRLAAANAAEKTALTQSANTGITTQGFGTVSYSDSNSNGYLNANPFGQNAGTTNVNPAGQNPALIQQNLAPGSTQGLRMNVTPQPVARF